VDYIAWKDIFTWGFDKQVEDPEPDSVHIIELIGIPVCSTNKNKIKTFNEVTSTPARISEFMRNVDSRSSRFQSWRCRTHRYPISITPGIRRHGAIQQGE
jgi:hypothetical protein